MTRGRAWTLWGVLCGLALVVAVGLWAGPDEGLPEDRGQAPAFTLTDQDGETVSDTDLRGRLVVASFIFTRCVLECPLLVQQQARLHQEVLAAGFEDQVVMLSFTVDPTHDTPAVLRTYAEQLGVPEAGTWHFLTGEEEELREVIVDGFKLAVGDLTIDEELDAPVVIHSTRFAIMDRDWRIRGYPDALETDRQEIVNTLRLLAR